MRLSARAANMKDAHKTPDFDDNKDSANALESGEMPPRCTRRRCCLATFLTLGALVLAAFCVRPGGLAGGGDGGSGGDASSERQSIESTYVAPMGPIISISFTGGLNCSCSLPYGTSIANVSTRDTLKWLRHSARIDGEATAGNRTVFTSCAATALNATGDVTIASVVSGVKGLGVCASAAVSNRTVKGGIIVSEEGQEGGDAGGCVESTVKVIVTGFSKSKGQAVIWLHNSPEEWDKDRNDWDDFNGAYWYDSKPIKETSDDGGNVTFTTTIGADAVNSYIGVLVLHDKDSNNKMKTDWLGMPKEGVVASNGAEGGPSGGPRWSDAKEYIGACEFVTFYLEMWYP